MTAPDTPDGVVAALNRVAVAIGAIPKADENTEQGFKFRGIETIMAKVGPAMNDQGVVPLTRVVDRSLETYPRGRAGNLWRLVTLTVEYELRHAASGEAVVVGPVIGEGFDVGDKAASKAHTMAWKRAVLDLFKIADGHDDPDRSGPPVDDVEWWTDEQRAAIKAASAMLDDGERDRMRGWLADRSIDLRNPVPREVADTVLAEVRRIVDARPPMAAPVVDAPDPTRAKPKGRKGDEPRPEPRSKSEAEARSIIDGLDPGMQTALRAAFLTEFGSTLASLDPHRHDEALAWVVEFVGRHPDGVDNPTEVG